MEDEGTLNDTFLRLLRQLHTLKMYEKQRGQTVGGMSELKAVAASGSNNKGEQMARVATGHPEATTASPAEEVPRKDYTDYLKQLDSINYKKDDKIKQFVQEVKSHQLRRIQYFESLPRNQESDMRQEAIRAYKENLLKFDQEDLNGLEYLVQKGMAMEQWQDLLENAQDDPEVQVGIDFVENKEDFMSKVIQNNLNVSEEIRGVTINGEERRGIEPTGGWGSGVRIQVDNASGDIDYAER